MPAGILPRRRGPTKGERAMSKEDGARQIVDAWQRMDEQQRAAFYAYFKWLTMHECGRLVAFNAPRDGGSRGDVDDLRAARPILGRGVDE